jgi:ubiquinone/menaquinone biosynthesis C-methylase UbiE
MTDNKQYLSFLLTRSTLARLYRKFYLYPRISKNFTGKVLDIGCGIGDFVGFRENTIGTDINKTIVEYCKKQGLNVVLFENEKLSFNDNNFDGVILDNVLEHIEEPTVILSEIKRVLKKNGTLIIGVPGIKGYEADSDHKCFFDDQRLSSIERFGFQGIKSFHTPLIKSAWLSRRIRQYCMYKVFKCNK